MCFMLACLFFSPKLPLSFFFFSLHLGHFFYAAPLPHSPTSKLATSQLTGMLSKTYCSPCIGGLIFLSHKVERLNQRACLLR